MQITALVVDKNILKGRKGNDLFKVTLVIIACAELPVLVGKSIEKFVESDFYNMVDVDATASIDFEVDVNKAYKPEYADLHLEVNVIGFVEPEPEVKDAPAEPVKPVDKNKDSGGKEGK